MIRCRFGDGWMDLAPSKIACLLRNYAAHAEEMKNAVPEKVRFFLKPPSSLLADGGSIVIPDGVRNVHHEVEMALLIGKRGTCIPRSDSMEYVKGFGVMLDITARGIQTEAKKKGLPWSEAKGYDTFAPVGGVFATADDFDYRSKRIWLSVNGTIRQEGNTDLMLFQPPEIISRISDVMILEPGDLILTGTPAGVGELNAGDVVKAGVEGICECCFNVVSKKPDHA